VEPTTPESPFVAEDTWAVCSSRQKLDQAMPVMMCREDFQYDRRSLLVPKNICKLHAWCPLCITGAIKSPNASHDSGAYLTCSGCAELVVKEVHRHQRDDAPSEEQQGPETSTQVAPSQARVSSKLDCHDGRTYGGPLCELGDKAPGIYHLLVNTNMTGVGDV
jgi:hypothetical protein